MIDRNGGRITHLFAMVDGRPVSLSGTFKAYQFLDVDWASRGRHQERRHRPAEHRLHARTTPTWPATSTASQGTIGAGPPDEVIFDWYYPDNFNAYQVVDGRPGRARRSRCATGRGTPRSRTPRTRCRPRRGAGPDRWRRSPARPGSCCTTSARFGGFRKTIRLDGQRRARQLPGHAAGAPGGQRVLRRPARGRAARAAPDARGGRRRAQRDGRARRGSMAVQVELGAGCEFTAATLRRWTRRP